MSTDTTQMRRADPVVQFSIFTPNRLGRLSDVIRLFGTHDVHALGLMVLDTTDSAIIRLVVDDPDKARQLLLSQEFPFTESKLVVVEVIPSELGRLMTAMLEAELNINYLYGLMPQPAGKPMMGMSVEDSEMAEQTLRRHQFRIMRQADLSR